MKNKIKILFILIIFIIAIIVVININKKNDTEEITDIVLIENGKIKNENLIDEFIKNVSMNSANNAELNIIQDSQKIKLTFISRENATDSSNDKKMGYYILTINDEVKGEYPYMLNSLKMKTENEKVLLYFESFLSRDVSAEICIYSLESTNYSKKFDLAYSKRNDLEIKTVFDTGKYKIKTFGGDVMINMEDGNRYTLEDALNQNIITPEDILLQAELDKKYGICKNSGMYLDGGSREYYYNEYTILKLNMLNGDRDLVIGKEGIIINEYNNNE